MAFKTVASTAKSIVDISDAFSVVLSNEAVTLTCDASGNPLTGQLGSTGTTVTTVTVYQGSTKLTAVPTASTPAVGQFKYDLSASGCTAVRTDDSTFYLSAVSANSGSVTVTITLNDGIGITKILTFAKAIQGGTGGSGPAGKGVSSVTEYYLATSSSSGVTTGTAGWTTTVQTMSSTNKYLWNYEKVTYTDSSTNSTTPVIIGVYGDTGGTGSAGKGVSSVTEYYLATNVSSGVTTGTAGWTTTVPTITSTNKYLWNYEKVTYTDSSTNTTTPVIIGVYGDTGADGPQGPQGNTGDQGPAGPQGPSVDEANIMNVNPNFYNWSGSLPDNYGGLSGTAPTKVASTNSSGYAARWVLADAGSGYFYQSITNRDYFTYFYVEASFMLESGALDGSGILFRVNATANVDSKLSFKTAVPSPTLNKWYTVSKIFKLSSLTPAGFTGFSVFPMGGWSSFEAVKAKTIQIDSVKVRPCTDAEIKAYDVNANTNNAITTIDGNGVNVKNGNFTLQDDISTTRYSVTKKTNLIRDHSFELSIGDTTTYDSANTYMTFTPVTPISGMATWLIEAGVPKLAYPYATEGFGLSPFNEKCMVINSTNCIYQPLVGLQASTTYTLSAHFRKHYSLTGGTPKLYVRQVDDFGTVIWSSSQTFATVPSNGSLVRYSMTFTLPSNYSDGSGVEFDVVLQTTDANYVQVDGVQLVQSSIPAFYDPEDGLHSVITGNTLVDTLDFRKNHYVGSGSPAISLNNGDITGINSMFMNDTATGDSEAMNWATDTTPAGSTNYADYDNFRIYNGNAFLNGLKFGVVKATNVGSPSSNGQYIQFTNGLQICWNYITVTDQAIATAYGVLYQGTRGWTFPAAFKSGTVPTCLCSEFKHGTGASWGTISSASTNTGTTLRGLDAYTRATGTTVYIGAFAIGVSP